MGLFSVISGAIGSIWGPIGTAVGTAAGSYLDTSMDRDYAEGQTKEAWKRGIYNYQHRYQWAANDMRAAGLNPILAATGGFNVGSGPSAPAPQIISQADPASSAGAVRSFEESRKVDSEIELNQARTEEALENVEKIGADTTKALQDVNESIDRAALARSQKGLVEAQEQNALEEWKRISKDIELKMQEIKTSAATMKREIAQAGLAGAATASEAARKKELEQLAKKAEQDTKLIMDMRVNVNAQGSKLRAISNVYETPVGKGLAAINEFVKTFSPLNIEIGGK